MRSILKLIASVFLALNLIGCVKKEVLDDISLIEGIGFDYIDKKNILGTVVIPVYLPDQPPKSNTFSTKAEITKSILQDIQRQTADPIVTGSIEVLLFSKTLTEKLGILPLVDAFQRDPSIGSGLYLAMVDGETKELLAGQYGIRGTATYISKLMEHNIRNEDLPKSNLELFLTDFYQEGKTPFIPQLKQIGKNKMEINGISLLKHGKMVDLIEPKEMFFFKLLVDKYSEGMHLVKIDSGEAAVRSIHSSHNFELTKRNPTEVTIHIKVDGIINEFTGQELTPKTIEGLQKQFEKDIKKESLKLIKRFKDKQLDPIGFGHFVKTQTRNFDFNNWRKNQYKDLVVKIKADVKISESGVIE
ncbi:spore germination protein [Neobacillus niacini]|uniref:Ger(x)C family spore germination protein n=1 Tax=Neobacillus niacini TaxID=86668 RepID=UPI002857841B|nr:Ger(x)C family spore germination protein [Neobacillus niacini]MDR7078494.1 spore germination protein [Neobacillus niacini]